MCLVLRGNWVLEVPPSVLTTQNIMRDLLLWKELEQTISPVPSLSVPQAAKHQVLWEDSELTGILSVLESSSLNFCLKRDDTAVTMKAIILRKDCAAVVSRLVSGKAIDCQ